MDFQALLDSLASNTTEVCCFNVTNITVITRRFQTTRDPIPVINDLIVSYTIPSHLSDNFFTGQVVPIIIIVRVC